MLESSSIRVPNSSASNLSIPTVSFTDHTISSDPLHLPNLHPCLFPPYPYSYLQHLAQHHQTMALPNPAPVNEHIKAYFPEHLKQYVPEHIKQYLPDHIKQYSTPEHFKQYVPEHLKQYFANEQFRNMVINDPLRLYLAQQELATAASTAAAIAAAANSNSSSTAEDSKEGIKLTSGITGGSHRCSISSEPPNFTSLGIHAINSLNNIGNFNTISRYNDTTNCRLQESSGAGNIHGSGSRNSIFSIESLLAPRNPPRLPAPLPRPPHLDLFGETQTIECNY